MSICPLGFTLKQHGELFDLHRVKGGKRMEPPYCSGFRSEDSAVRMAKWLAARDELRQQASVEDVERVLEARVG